MKKIGSEFNRSKQPCAEHFRSRYDNPPLWAVVDVMTFGTISLLLKAMSRPDQNAVASHYGIRGDYLASYMQHATVLRNLCAHHCRVFDFPYSNLKMPPREFVFAPLNIWKKRGVDIRADRPFIYQAALLYHLLAPTGNAVFSREDWKQDICSHFRSLPESISRRVCGYIDFPTDAESSPLWSL